MIELIQNVIESIGYSGIALLVFIENIFPPIPSEIVIPFSGFAAKRGGLTLPGVIFAGTLGAVLGAYPLYYLGRQVGRERLYRLSEKYGKYIGLPPQDLDRAFHWMDTRGQLAVFLCRMVPGLRSVISIPAGVVRQSFWQFTLWTTLGSFIWTFLLSVAGWYLGANYDALAPYIDTVGTAVTVLIFAFMIYRALKVSLSTSPNN